jgi:hypothetical protein
MSECGPETGSPGINAWATGIIANGVGLSIMYHLFRRTRSVFVTGLALLAVGAREVRVPQSGTAAVRVDVERLGPQVGTSLPDFTLPDQRGELRSLRSLLGPKGAIIVFFRSADW